MPESSEKKYNEKSNETKKSRRLILVRGVWYFLGVVLLFLVTILVFFSLFSNNWQRTVPSNSVINDKFQEYYSFGVWFTCRHVSITWLDGTSDVYCSLVNNDLGI